MLELKLKNGEAISALLIEREDEDYIYLQHVTKKNLDGSETYYYRYWVRKDEVITEKVEEKVEELKAEAQETVTASAEKRRRKK
ncbi:MAG: hypothetical protein QXO75_11555 [Nitrososphaerota archaeon]